MNNRRSDPGSTSVELVIMTPILMVLALFVVLSGHSGEALRQVQHAADQGARAASQASALGRQQSAISAASTDLQASGISCRSPRISVESIRLGRLDTVRVTVSCNVEHSGLALLRLHERRVVADSTEVIDYYRTK